MPYRFVAFAIAFVLTLQLSSSALAQPLRGQPVDVIDRPNIVIIFADDLGYGDLGAYGATGYSTPHLDRMAKEGIRFDDFYVSQAVCSASRSSLLTGCFSNRVSIFGALGPGSRFGLHPDEETIADLLKGRGYATAAFGKWHLGDHPSLLPTAQGFDEYFGLPYSNDMWPFHPTTDRFPKLPLIEGTKVIDHDVTPDDQTLLTTRYTERAVDFIERNRKRPFFLYLPHSMPHVPLYVSDKFKGKSEQGLYGDVMMEIDWSVGQILAALDRHGLDERTLVIFTSDNGPWLSYGNHAGSAGPLREGKGTAWDGGQREPFLARWPGRIPAGAICREVAGTIDLLPTIASLTGANLPKKKIDGKDIWPLLSGVEGAETPHQSYPFYWGRNLHAIRMGDWKLHFPHGYRSLAGQPGRDGRPGGYVQKRTDLALYNLREDIGEKTDLATDRPEIVAKLTAEANRWRKKLGDGKRAGSEVRPPGRVTD